MVSLYSLAHGTQPHPVRKNQMNLIIIPAIAAAILGVYVFVPRGGVQGFTTSGVIVAGFFATVYLTKLIILA